MKRYLVAAVVALFAAAMFTTGALSSSSTPPKNGQVCYKGAWATLYGTSGVFASQSDCVSYVAKGGVTKTISSLVPALTSTITGPVTGLGALVGNPQSRVSADGITDPAMLFTVGGSGWLPGQTVVLSYTADPPLNYTFDNPTTYFLTAPALTSTGIAGTIGSWFQDNCFDSSNVLVSGNVNYTLTASDSYGQHATMSGTLNCDLIAATVLASSGPLVAPNVQTNAVGWHFPSGAPVTVSYVITGSSDGPQTIGTFTAAADGSFSATGADNCIYNMGSGEALQHTNLPMVMTATDGTNTATATGTLNCTLAPSVLFTASADTVGTNGMVVNANGYGFAPNTTLTSMLYSVPAFPADGLNQDLSLYTTLPTTDANGNFVFSFDGDNCIYGGIKQTGDYAFTLVVSDGVSTASATGTLKCSLLP